MVKRWSVRQLFVLVLFVIVPLGLAIPLFPTPSHALAIPLACANSLVYNPSMNANPPDAELADGWSKFVISSPAPTFQHVTNEQIDPGGSQYIWTDIQPFDAGIYQTVTGLTPGQYYRFYPGYALAAQDPGDGVNHRTNRIGRQVGVDPTGGTNPLSSNVIWSTVFYNGQAALNIPALTLTFIAQTANATIFLRAINTDSTGRNKVWFDAVCMQHIDPQPTATFTPTQTPTPTNTPTRVTNPPPVQTAVYLPLISSWTCSPSLVTTLDVGWHPKGVAVDPTTGRISVGLADAASVSFVDTLSNVTVSTWWAGAYGAGNGVGATNGRSILSLRDLNSAVIMTSTTGALIAAKSVGTSPYAIGAANGRAWVANFNSGDVTIIDALTVSVVATRTVGGNPSLVAAAGNRAFVSFGSGVAEIKNDGTVLHNYTGLGSSTYGVAYNSSTDRLYVADRLSNQVSIVDATLHTTLKSVLLTQTPFALAINPDTNHLFVVYTDTNQVDILDGSTLARIGLLTVGTQGVDGGDGIAVYNGRVYVANHDAGTLTVIQDTCVR